MPAILWMALIFIGSTDILSAEHTSRFLTALNAIQIAIRKLGHLTEYAILAALLWRALRSGTAATLKMPILFGIVLIACAGFAASDEFHQSFVPSRTSSARDVMIDICGALIGLTICVALASGKVLKEKRV